MRDCKFAVYWRNTKPVGLSPQMTKAGLGNTLAQPETADKNLPVQRNVERDNCPHRRDQRLDWIDFCHCGVWAAKTIQDLNHLHHEEEREGQRNKNENERSDGDEHGAETSSLLASCNIRSHF